jgi:hypothetical protein
VLRINYAFTKWPMIVSKFCTDEGQLERGLQITLVIPSSSRNKINLSDMTSRQNIV